MQFLFNFLCIVGVSTTAIHAAPITIDNQMYHLGTPGFPEWSSYENRKPHGRELHLKFAATLNETPMTLLWRQDGVKQGWGIYLNGKRLGNLERVDARLEQVLEIPAGRLRDGENALSIRAPKQIDDISVGRFQLLAGKPTAALSRGSIDIHVNEGDSPSPCRITIARPDNTLAALFADPIPSSRPQPAVRPGVVYTGNGRARIHLLPGQYVVYASRGFEYSVASQRINVLPQTASALRFSLEREVATEGWVSVDSHIHVRDFSGHGDSSVDERMSTIAGEGLELAISTDHNRHANYEPAAKRTRVNGHFTTVIGNEVTTKAGHFNAFPIAAEASLPDYKQTNWTRLLQGIRNTKGVQVIQLNHPRNVHGGYSPTSTNEFDLLTGSHRREISFDAMEVVTSAAMQSDIMALFHDWFALLNRGHRIVGVASSDTHDVSRFILGQARTYVRAADDKPANIDIDQVCQNMLKGRALISMGLLTEIAVNGRFKVGDLAMPTSDHITASVKVYGPRWSKVDRIRLYANGIKVADQAVENSPDSLKASQTFNVRVPGNDFHLVAIATGPGIMEPYWETPRPYQPTSKTFEPLSIGATNPVWIDSDRNGKFDSPHQIARRVLAKIDGDLNGLRTQLRNFDAAVAVQINSMISEELKSAALKEFQTAAGRLRRN